MLFDTDVLIFIQRGNTRAAKLFEDSKERCISIQTYMELLQAAKNKEQHKYIVSFIKDYYVQVLPLTENIGHRAAIYIEEYTLSNGIRAGDAIIASTAVENGLQLITANKKHFKPVKELDLKVFLP